MARRIRHQLWLRTTVFLAILLFSGASMKLFSVRLVGHLHKYWGARFLKADTLDGAAVHLNRARDYLPADGEVRRMLGQLFFNRSVAAVETETIFRSAIESENHYLQALALNPMDAESAYGMAVVQERLERLSGYGYPYAASPDSDALHYYRVALDARPNGIRFAYGLARYLHRKGMAAELRVTVRRLCRTYPPVIRNLRTEPFWSSEIRKACREGLQIAIAEGIKPRQAREQLSAIFVDAGQWEEAASLYQTALEIDTYRNTAENHFHLGRLNLKAGNEKGALGFLLHALHESQHPESHMKRALDLFAEQKNPDLAAEFHSILKKRFSPYRDTVEILWARFLMDQNRPDDARGVLEALARRSHPEAYFLLARIAQEGKDWDRAELAIQKATLLDPRNVQYRLMFSRILWRLGKLDRAEREADVAIRFSPEPTPWIYNHRARIRWRKGEYKKAAEDWEQASELAPNRAVFRANMGKAQEKLGNKNLAVAHYKAAIELDPGNEGYRRQLRALDGMK